LIGADNPGSLESKIETAYRAGAIQSPDDIRPIMAQHFGGTAPATTEAAQPAKQESTTTPERPAIERDEHGRPARNFAIPVPPEIAQQGNSDVTNQIRQQESVQPERSGNDAGRPPYETGSGRGIRQQEEGKERSTTKRNVDEIPTTATLNAEGRDVETRFRHYLANNFDEAVRRYEEIHGKVINTDLVRDLSSDYAESIESKSRHAMSVEGPSRWFARELYRMKVKEPPAPGEEPHSPW